MTCHRLAALLLVAAACRGASPGPGPAPAPPRPVVVIAAGDVSPPTLGAQQATADLVLREQPDAVLVLGDAQYPDGSAADFAAAYAPTWGRFKDRTFAVPGNHEYKRGSAQAYFDYFGERGGDPARGYRSFDLGAWHVVALNTNHECRHVPCDDASEQVRWLEADLAGNTRPCVLAFWHHPRFNPGSHGDFTPAAAFWRVLARHGVELVLNGHEHVYERLGPMDPSGAPAPDGIVQFIVGTGGVGLSDFPAAPHPARAARGTTSHGVLRLELADEGWTAEFLPVGGGDLHDRAAGRCR